MQNRRNWFRLSLISFSLLALQGCAKSTPPLSEENSDPPMISMESAVPEEQPAGSFKMAVGANDGLESGKAIDLDVALAPAKDGDRAPKLRMRDTNFLVVSMDGKDFQRIKPVESAPGALKVAITFPHDGQYQSCLQFTTSDGKNYSVTAPLQVGKGKTGVAPLKVDTSNTKEVDGYTVLFVDRPEHPSDKLISMPSLRVSKDRRPSSNIEAIDGRAGYAIVIKEGEEKFLRTMSVSPQSASKFFQQPIMFHVKITEPGVYRMWAQFKIDDAIHTVNYTFNVTAE